jgi:uncharacterized membrane protein YfcA
MQLLGIIGLTFFASIIGTLTGFGTSTIMVPILAIFLPLPQVLLLVGIIHFFGDLWKMLLFREGIRWRLILTFGVPGIVASFFGARLIFSFPEHVLTQMVGAILVGYATFLLLNPSFRMGRDPGSTVTAGAASGFLAGLSGVGGAVRGAFLAAWDLPKAAHIATSGALGSVVDLTRVVTYVGSGIRLAPWQLHGLVLFIVASFLGARVAQNISHHVSDRQFRLIVALFLFLVGMKLAMLPS